MATKTKATPTRSRGGTQAEARDDLLVGPGTTFPRGPLLEAVALADGILGRASNAPARETHVLLESGPDGCTVSATSEVAVRRTVEGCTTPEPLRLFLPGPRFKTILGSIRGPEVRIDPDGDKVAILGDRLRVVIPVESPDLFPAASDGDDAVHLRVDAPALREAVRRTEFACDDRSTRYALGGALLMLEEPGLVATDGRQLACAAMPCEVAADAPLATRPIIPARALKLLETVLDGDQGSVAVTVLMSGTVASGLLFRTESTLVRCRCVEGRFPAWELAVPSGDCTVAEVQAGPLLRALDQARITTSEVARGVTLTIDRDHITFTSEASDVGSSRVALDAQYPHDPFTVTIDPAYPVEMLRRLAPDTPLRVELRGPKDAILFRAGDHYRYAVSPLSVDQ